VLVKKIKYRVRSERVLGWIGSEECNKSRGFSARFARHMKRSKITKKARRLNANRPALIPYLCSIPTGCGGGPGGQIADVWRDQGLGQAGERGEEKKGRSGRCSLRAGSSRLGRNSSSGGGELAGSALGGGGAGRGRAGEGAGLGRAGAQALPL
jgi:hypothetical protein